MPSKTEYESTINEFLGTDIKWSALTKDELVEFATLLANPVVFAEKLRIDSKKRKSGSNIGEIFVEGILSRATDNGKLFDGSIKKKLMDLIDQKI